ncbi:c-type cytochrome [Methylobacterium sp. A54F]
MRLRPPAAALLVAALCTGKAAAGPFTEGQAERGAVVFNDYCAECHRPDLTGALGPALVGAPFRARWGGRPVSDLRDWIRANMPPNAPDTLPDAQLDPITAWILRENGERPGSRPLGSGTAGAPFPR